MQPNLITLEDTKTKGLDLFMIPYKTHSVKYSCLLPRYFKVTVLAVKNRPTHLVACCIIAGLG